MAKKFPDRVAAIVDLMSHLFMLAVMLFVLEIPFRPVSSVAIGRSLKLTIGVSGEDGQPLRVVLNDKVGEDSKLTIEIRLDDGRQLWLLEDSLKYLRKMDDDGRIRVEGYFREAEATKAVLIVTKVSDELITKKIVIGIVSQINGGVCNETGTIVVGHDPFYRFSLDSCLQS
jgi:hypothetical protein